MARCEDFPACGHYDPRTGETYCREATMSPEEREIEAAERRHEDELREIRKRHERQRDLDSRPQTCKAAYAAAPETYINGSDIYDHDIKAALAKLEQARGEDDPWPTYAELAAVVGAEALADAVSCHEDCEGFKACAPCTAEWEADAENYRREEEYVFGPPDTFD